jgi:hypothetical protein
MNPDHVITNPARLNDLVAFANARRDSVRPGLITMPSGDINVAFYKEGEFLGAIAVGTNFFVVACPGWEGLRKASNAEIHDFKRLVGLAAE